MPELKIKTLNPDTPIPSYATEGDAGLDLVATSKEVVKVGDEVLYVEYGTGICVEIPKGHVGLLFPRSSVSKKSLILSNSVGVIDAGYRGEIKARFKQFKSENISKAHYEVGEKAVQLIVIPFVSFDKITVVDELSSTERGEGGFGSTGS